VDGMTTFSESDIREAFQTFDRDGNGFIGISRNPTPRRCAWPTTLRLVQHEDGRGGPTGSARAVRFSLTSRPFVLAPRSYSSYIHFRVLCCLAGASDLHNTYLAINENLTDDEVDELIRLCDHDGDGQVCPRLHSQIVTTCPRRIFRYVTACMCSAPMSMCKHLHG
jgi:hypothetical protein